MKKTNNKWLSFEAAREIVKKDVKKYKITGCKSWQEIYVNKRLIPNNIPKQPHCTYRDSGWISWGDWLGTNSQCNSRIKFLSFEKAYASIKNDVENLHIDGHSKWVSIYGKIKPDNIPLNPQRTYKNKGWISWGHWLRTGNKQFGKRKYSLNENFFKVWSHDMAYILGFWFADGCVKKGRTFSIYQHKKDKKLMKHILEKMNAEEYFYNSKNPNHCYISVSSKIIYEDILRLGGTERKSLTVLFPNIPKEYMSSFLRGNFDGDGSIFYDKTNKRYYSCFCSASFKFIDKMKSVFDELMIPCKIVVSKSGLNPFYWLKFNAANTVLLGSFLYDGVKDCDLVMPRKQKKFMLSKNNICRSERKKLCTGNMI